MLKTDNQTYTYEDYLKLDDNNRYELINGELIMAPSPISNHQKIVGDIFFKLKQLEQTNKGQVYISPLDVVFSDTEVYQPDVLFILNENSDIIRERIFGVPDLVIEVTSPSTEQIDRQVKYSAYEHHGVKEYWIVDEKNGTVEVFALQNNEFARIVYAKGDETASSKLIDGFSISLKNIF